MNSTETLPVAQPISPKEFHFDLFGRLTEHARDRPGHIILQLVSTDGREEFSYGRFVDEVRSVGSYLQNRGVSPGDRVAILMENQPRWGVAFLAAQSVGAIVVPLDTLASVSSLAKVIDHSDSRFLIASGRFNEEVNAILPLLARRIGLLMNGAPWEAGLAESRGPEFLPHVPRDIDDSLTILYTGGTTGTPKGVLLTQRNLYRSIADMLRVFPLSTSDRILCLLPLYHVMPLLANLLAPLCTGATVTYLSALDPQRVLRVFQEERITALLCVPQFYYQLQRRMLDEVARQPALGRLLFRRLLALSGFFRRNFGINIGKRVFATIHQRFGGRIRAFGIGGAYCNPAVAEFLADLGFGVFQAYGLTESAGLSTVTPLDRNGGLSCGIPVAHVDIRIAEPDDNGIGQILVRGENIMAGYWKDADATAAVLKEGWLHTGDLGVLSPSGELRITGRSKEVIVLSSGKNIFPEELEQFFLSHCPLFQEICIIGLEDRRSSGASRDGAKLHAVIVPDFDLLKSRHAVNIDLEVRNQIENLMRSLPAHKRVGSFEIRTEPLPRTTTRKLQRFKVLELAAKTKASVPDSVAVDDMVGETEAEREVLQLLRRVKGDVPVQSRMNLELDLGFDSLERVELFSNIERHFRIRISEEEAGAVFTVHELMNLVETRSPQHVTPDVAWRDWSAILREPLTADERKLADECLRHNLPLELFAYGVVRSLFLCGRLLVSIKTKYSAELPDSSFLICPNHTSYLDNLLVPGALRWKDFRRLFFLAANKYFRGALVVRLARTFRVLPVDPDRHLVSALRLSKVGLERGLVLCVFPEGTRSIDGTLKPLQKGPAILATELALPAVAMGVRGAYETWPKGAGFNGFHPIEISVGVPLIPLPGESAEEFNRRLFEGIRAQSCP